MLRLVVDENFNNNILRGLLRKNENLDIVRIQDYGLSGIDDKSLLKWTIKENRILLTHDVSTITKYAYELIENGESFPGIFEVRRSESPALVIEDILLLVETSIEGEWINQIIFLPLK